MSAKAENMIASGAEFLSNRELEGFARSLSAEQLRGKSPPVPPMREIIFYETDFGDKPVEQFLIGLDPAARAKTVRSLEMLRTIPVVPAKFWRKLSDQKLWEVRAEYAGNIYRILATTAKGNRVILLHGFQKKSQKTPRQDMEIAQQRQKRYFQSHGYL